jgi:hypothetical protein
MQGHHTECIKILCWQKLGKNGVTIVGGVGGVNFFRFIIICEPYKTGVLYPSAFGIRHREDNTLCDIRVVFELQIVKWIGQPGDFFQGHPPFGTDAGIAEQFTYRIF